MRLRRDLSGRNQPCSYQMLAEGGCVGLFVCFSASSSPRVVGEGKEGRKEGNTTDCRSRTADLRGLRRSYRRTWWCLQFWRGWCALLPQICTGMLNTVCDYWSESQDARRQPDVFFLLHAMLSLLFRERECLHMHVHGEATKQVKRRTYPMSSTSFHSRQCCTNIVSPQVSKACNF